MILLKNVRWMDWRYSCDEPCDILVHGGRIARIGQNLPVHRTSKLDAKGLVAIPGLVDVHVHVRQPGFEHKETVKSATQAALAGGVTNFCAMPNVSPCPDSPENWEIVRSYQYNAPLPIVQAGAVNRGLQMESCDWREMFQKGCRLFTNDGYPIERHADMVEVLRFSRETGAIVAQHAEMLGMDESTTRGEARVIERDLSINASEKGNLHVQHVSLEESVSLLERARGKGIRFSAETCPHYFCAVEPGLPVGAYNVYPPLRTPEDRSAIVHALSSGVISILCSDHAPHTRAEKTGSGALRGFSGVELLFSLGYNELVLGGKMGMGKLLDLMSRAPSVLLGMEPVSIEVGRRADLVLFDPEEEWVVEESTLFSHGKNTPFLGKKLKGKIKYTIVQGKVLFPFRGRRGA